MAIEPRKVEISGSGAKHSGRSAEGIVIRASNYGARAAEHLPNRAEVIAGVEEIGRALLLALSEEAGKDGAGGRMIACLDAHMGEVYHAAYRRAGAGWEEVSAPGLYRPEAVPVAPGRDWTGCGDGFAAYRERLAARLGECVAAIRPEATPSARAVLKLAIPRFAAGEAKDAATAVPVYLRDKVALKTSERR